MSGKIILILVLLVLPLFQGLAQKRKDARLPLDWHMLSFGESGFYGAEVYRAYDFLKDRKPLQKVVVAVIDVGVDPEHEDLERKLWVNRDEIPGNGVDDDRNGYVDDVHGWNFLGTADGKLIRIASTEADRLFMEYRRKFENADTNRLSAREKREYRYYTRKIIPASALGQAYTGMATARRLVKYLDGFDRELHTRYPGVRLERKHYISLLSKDEKDVWRKAAHNYFLLGWGLSRNASWEQVLSVRNRLVKDARVRYEKAMAGFLDGRSLVGDNMGSVRDRCYGNAILMSDNAAHGTHVAGIIGADRDNDWGMKGIADVELMIVRVGSKGDEYDKDVANAIRYAVDNGANIINMSFGKPFSPQKEWVDAALKHAERKNVLVVHAVGNSFADIDSVPVYPGKYTLSGKELKNFISVGSVAPDGNPAVSSSYGKKNADLFAPGVDIYSTVTDGNYKKMGGTSMACPVVAGIAALVWNYFPDLSAVELKHILLKSVTSRKGVEVLKPKDRTLMMPRETILFDDLCRTAGIVNAYQAVRMADEFTKNK